MPGPHGLASLLATAAVLCPLLSAHAQTRQTLPVLSFPEQGLDDPAAYGGYQTRFFRDSKGNAVQIYLTRDGRAVQLWADAANESIGFTVRDTAGRPVRLTWGSKGAQVSDSGPVRFLEHQLTAESPQVEIGWFILGSMRLERDLQYARRHLESFDALPFEQPELCKLLANVARLEVDERERHLALLRAKSLNALHARLRPTITSSKSDTSLVTRVEQPSFDGRNHLALEFHVDPDQATAEVTGRTVTIRSHSSRPVELTLRSATDAEPLTPLSREQIFNKDFFRFLARAHAAHDSVLRAAGGEPLGAADSAIVVRYQRLVRAVRSVELLSTEEKLMAGMPNFATYFGRDVMMTALMMDPIWSNAMPEHVVASVLRKLSPTGQVSHEEALGGQAIRENAAEYNTLLSDYVRLMAAGDHQRADSVLGRAREILGDLQAVRENYRMMDDEFQLVVLAARYLGDSSISADRKRQFLLETSHDDTSRLALLLRELGLVAEMATPYAEQPVTENLIAFPKREDDSTHWFPGSWRDSGDGYANGRFAMDINVIWVPQALEAIGQIFASLRTIGFTRAALDSLAPEMSTSPLGAYARDPDALRSAVRVWQGSARHFTVAFSPEEIEEHVRAKLEWLPEEEGRYWESVMRESGVGNRDSGFGGGGAESRVPNPDSLVFLALSLDADGRPIPVVNTDPAMRLFLEDRIGVELRGGVCTECVLRDVEVFTRPYPVGLFVARLGPLVANDTYASREVWEPFRDDLYHSPRVVWGREVNLFVLGVANQISATFGASGRLKDAALGAYVRALDNALRQVVTAVEASRLDHNELWSYEIKNGRLLPVRYGTTSDIQLWNLTDLAVQFVLSRLPRR